PNSAQKPADTAVKQPEKPPTQKPQPEKKPEPAEPPKISQANTTESKPSESKPVETKPVESKVQPEVKEPPVKPAPSDTAKPEPVAAAPKQPSPPQSPMVMVPAGEFIMGTNKGPIDNEKPQRKVYLPAFYIDVYEVTNAEFKLFCDATGHPYPENPAWDPNYFLTKPTNPVINVTWYDANTYAQWVGKRLPTEEEWEKAARGTDGRLWPWGKDFNTSLANLEGKEDGYDYTAPIGSFRAGASIYGALDMTGNVWEWTSSIYKPYPDSPDNDKRYQQENRVIRGGGYQSPSNILRGAAFRFPSEPDQAYEATGFRCAKNP